jgi:hypothetical protein
MAVRAEKGVAVEELMPADGKMAAAKKRDFGTSLPAALRLRYALPGARGSGLHRFASSLGSLLRYRALFTPREGLRAGPGYQYGRLGASAAPSLTILRLHFGWRTGCGSHERRTERA